MAETLTIPQSGNRQEIYEALLPQIKALVASEPDLTANLANISAVLKSAFDFLWVGFYMVQSNELVLGPFQGPVACTRIGFGRGVCGTAWKEKQAFLVPDVDIFPGHIACSSASRSEIVLPAFKNNEVFLVLDVDSEHIDYFNEIDLTYLQGVIDIIENLK